MMHKKHSIVIIIMCHFIILLYVLQFIVDIEVVTVSILNENIQFVVYWWRYNCWCWGAIDSNNIENR